MKTKVYIAREYEGNASLEAFIHALPQSFEQGGEMLWNGRNKIKSFAQEDGKDIVVKRFKSLKAIQKLGYLFRDHKAHKAFVNGQELIRRGFDTPAPVACVEHYGGGLIGDAYYICLRNDMPPIEDLLCRDDWDRELATAFARFVVSLHRQGILHHDLNDTNVRYARNADGKYVFSLIDINRMNFYDNMEAIPMKERIENMTRFTGRISLFEYVAREYSRAFGLDENVWTQQAVEQKKRHDRNWYRRKRLLHPLRKRK